MVIAARLGKVNRFRNIIGFGLLVLAGLALWLTIYKFVRDDSERAGPVGATKLKMKKLESHIEAFHLETGNWPEARNWESELRHILDSDIYFGQTNKLLDSWGNKIIYEVVLRGGITNRLLHSFGPNGKNDQGLGDDIILAVPDH